MRVLMLPDAEFLDRERGLLQRIEIGLADEGVRLLHAAPASTVDPSSSDAPVVYATPITYYDRGLPLTLPLRLSALARAIETAAPADQSTGERIVDIVYALGASTWGMALGISQRLGARLVIEVWSASLIDPAANMWGRALAARKVDPRRRPRENAPTFLTPLAAVASALARRVPSDRITHVPWGVHPADIGPRAIDLSRCFTVVLLSSGKNPRAVEDAISALALASERIPTLLAFVDAGLAERTPIWKLASSSSVGRGLNERLTVIAELESRRELITQADVLLIPEPLGELRSIVLDAMACGMLVVARKDPQVEDLIQGQTAALVSEPGPHPLAAALIALAEDHDRAARLRASAWSYIHDRRAASDHIRVLLAAFDRSMASALN